MSDGVSELVRLKVNSETCIGSGLCEMLAAACFAVDEDTNIATVIGDGTLSAERAPMVIDACPASAISIVDDG